MKRDLKIILRILLPFLLLIAFWRLCMYFNIEKTKVDFPEIRVPEQDLTEIGLKLEQNRMDLKSLINKIEDARLLLVGETHFKKEVMAYFVALLDNLSDDGLVLCLELPSSVQSLVDNYLEDGLEHHLDSLKSRRDCLPAQTVLRWCHRNPERIKKVVAIDQNRKQIRFNRRYLCRDRRNRVMARRLHKVYREYPDEKIIFYGGQLHMLKSGRYKYDIRNRTPVGGRMLERGVPEEDMRIVMIGCHDSFPLAPAWGERSGAIEMRGDLAKLPFNYFYEYPVFRVQYAGELFDLFVNVGDATDIER